MLLFRVHFLGIPLDPAVVQVQSVKDQLDEQQINRA